MNIINKKIRFCHIEEILVASQRTIITDRSQLIPIFDKMYSVLGKNICGPPFAIFYLDTGNKEGDDVEACYPISSSCECDYDVKTIVGGDAFIYTHIGDHEKIDSCYGNILSFIYRRGCQIQSVIREVYSSLSLNSPENNVTDLVVMLHPWKQLLIKSIENKLGSEKAAEAEIMGSAVNPESSIETRREWIRKVIELIEGYSDKRMCYNIMSPCADKFSEERIAILRSIYEKYHDVDDVIEAMKNDQDWYSEPYRVGNRIYVTKNPYRKAAYEKAKTREEKRKYYCHCPVIRDNLDSGISSTYCYCGAGWFRQQWEGILGKHVEIELMRSLLQDDEVCEFCIKLPLTEL